MKRTILILAVLACSCAPVRAEEPPAVTSAPVDVTALQADLVRIKAILRGVILGEIPCFKAADGKAIGCGCKGPKDEKGPAVCLVVVPLEEDQADDQP